MAKPNLTRRQQQIYNHLKENLHTLPHPPTLDELCKQLGLKSRGSLHKQLQALIEAGLVEPMNKLRRGVRLAQPSTSDTQTPQTAQVANSDDQLPLYGYIAAGRPIEAIAGQDTVNVPAHLRTNKPCFVLEVRGDSMIEDGILDGDWVVIEQREQANNGEVVVALIGEQEATLKRFENKNDEVVLHPANSNMDAMHFHPSKVRIQGVLVGQMRRYH